MTRPAEALTVEIAGEDGIWTTRAVGLHSKEHRPVMPADFARWFSERWTATQAGWLARKLTISRLPGRLSTAVGLVVRLELRGARLFRRWVAFSVVERALLEKCHLDGAQLERNGKDEAGVRFVFDAAEPSLMCEGPLELNPCEELAPLHWYRRPELERTRVIELVSGPCP